MKEEIFNLDLKVSEVSKSNNGGHIISFKIACHIPSSNDSNCSLMPPCEIRH